MEVEAENVAGAEVQLPETNEGTAANTRKRKATSEADESQGAPSESPSAEDAEGGAAAQAAEGAKPGAEPGQQGATDQPLSKKAMKRLKKAEEMKVKRKFQRAQRKERQKKAKEEAKARGPRVLAEGEDPPMSKWKQKKKLTRERVTLPQRVVIDCSFDSQMTDREVVSLVNQLARCYSCNNGSTHCLQFHLTSFGGKTEERLKTVLSGFENWRNITVDPRGYMDVFKKEELVYLTAESPNVIQTLEDDKVYIIGGLVDHNRLKGITYKIAQEQGIATAQLPIGEYLQMASRKVLTVNHVFEILLKFKLNNDWEKTLLEVVPKRKGAHSRVGDNADEDEDEDEDDGSAGEDEPQQSSSSTAPSAAPTASDVPIAEPSTTIATTSDAAQQQDAAISQ